MIEISKNLSGGNIRVLKVENNTVCLSNEDRDTDGGYFYWSFCISGAQGKRLRFIFDNDERIGFYGAAVSYDNSHWLWQYEDIGQQGAEFTYQFSDSEDVVYFAHSMQYCVERFLILQNKTILSLTPFVRQKR